MLPNAYVQSAQIGGWEAALNLRFANRFNKTLLVQRNHTGPLTVQRPFYPEGDVCHVYLLHPPGGIVGGDDLTISINAETGSHALITTPAAGKFYRSDGLWASQKVNIDITEGAVVEWLPQETIIYQGAQLKSTININLANSARFIGWEILSLGRPASGEGFDYGAVDLNWHIRCDHRPLFLERLRLDAEAFAARWGLQGFSACGTFFAKTANKQSLAAVQNLIANEPCRGVTLIDDILICRALDARSDRLRAFFEQVWATIRPEVLQRQSRIPRIWLT
ncbi:urease accessory protein UreD [Methyloglobulus sp.]|uniref:urease accessory protein UreD n=1 Tax=Methyloglobulus sp. TaxID=2518622 RepID=UPI0032B766F3